MRAQLFLLFSALLVLSEGYIEEEAAVTSSTDMSTVLSTSASTEEPVKSTSDMLTSMSSTGSTSDMSSAMSTSQEPAKTTPDMSTSLSTTVPPVTTHTKAAKPTTSAPDLNRFFCFTGRGLEHDERPQAMRYCSQNTTQCYRRDTTNLFWDTTSAYGCDEKHLCGALHNQCNLDMSLCCCSQDGCNWKWLVAFPSTPAPTTTVLPEATNGPNTDGPTTPASHPPTPTSLGLVPSKYLVLIASLLIVFL